MTDAVTRPLVLVASLFALSRFTFNKDFYVFLSTSPRMTSALTYAIGNGFITRGRDLVSKSIKIQ